MLGSDLMTGVDHCMVWSWPANSGIGSDYRELQANVLCNIIDGWDVVSGTLQDILTRTLACLNFSRVAWMTNRMTECSDPYTICQHLVGMSDKYFYPPPLFFVYHILSVPYCLLQAVFLPCLPDGLWTSTESQKMIRGAHACIVTSLLTKKQQDCTPNLTWQPSWQKCLPI